MGLGPEQNHRREESKRDELIYEVKSSITDDDLRAMDQFIQNEFGEMPTHVESDTWKIAMQSLSIHVSARKALSVYPGTENHRVNAAFAKNKAGEIIGYSVVKVDPTQENPNEKVIETYLGVRQAYREQGIGSELLRRRIEALKDLRIEGYTALIQSSVESLYKRLGLDYSAVPHPHGYKLQLTVKL